MSASKVAGQCLYDEGADPAGDDPAYLAMCSDGLLQEGHLHNKPLLSVLPNKGAMHIIHLGREVLDFCLHIVNVAPPSYPTTTTRTLPSSSSSLKRTRTVFEFW